MALCGKVTLKNELERMGYQTKPPACLAAAQLGR